MSSHEPGWAEVALLPKRPDALWRAQVPAGWRNLQQLFMLSRWSSTSLPVLSYRILWKHQVILMHGGDRKAELLQDAKGNRKGPAWARERTNFCLHMEHLKEASAFLQTSGDCQCVIAWTDEGRMPAFKIRLSFGYLLNTFFVCWKDFLLVQEELSILFLLVTRIYVSEYVPSLLFSGK